MNDDNRSKNSALALTTLRDPEELETSIRRQLENIDVIKWPIGLQAFENASYLLGNHLTRFYYTADSGFGFHHFGQHDSSQFDNLVAKSSDNKLIRPTEAVSSMLMINQPVPRIEGNSDTPEDRDAAELSELLIQLLWDKPLNMSRLTRDAAILGCVSPTVAIEIEYGPTEIPVEIPRLELVEDEITEELVERDTGKTDVVYRQDFQARLWNFFHLHPDPMATSPEDMTWIARQSYVDLDWIRDKFDVDGDPRYFPKKLKEITAPARAENTVLYWWSKFQDIIPSPQYYQHGGGLTPQTFTTHGGYAPNQVLFTVIDVKPSAEFPKGRTLIMADTTLVYAGDARAWSERYPWRWQPYAFWGWFRLPGRFWHTPLLSQLVPLQKKINAIDALTHANRQFMSIGQWLIPEHAEIPDGMMSGIPAQEVRYTDIPGHSKPERIDNKPLPESLLAERAQLERSIEHISASGVGDPSISPSANRSGAQMQGLERMRLQTKTPMLREFERMIETCAQNILIEAQIHLVDGDEELASRLRAAAPKHSSFQVENFSSASLRDHHDVKIDITSQQFNTPEAQAQKSMEYLQYAANAAHIPAHVNRGILQKLGLDEFAVEEENMSVRYAERLLSRIRQGQLPEIEDDQLASLLMPRVAKAMAMYPVFANYVLTDPFNDLEDEQKKLIFKLMELLEQLSAMEQQEQMQQQLAMMQAAEGGGPPTE
jgi:hypothetical protein